MNMSIYKYLILFGLLLVSLSGCESYLEKTPEADLTEEDIFRNYNTFQGFVDPCYYACVNYIKKQGCTMDLGDDVVAAWGGVKQANDGDYWGLSTNGMFASGWGGDGTPVDQLTWGIWEACMQSIRRANVALEHLDMLVNATDEERDLLKGQCLFFRAWSYFELSRVWGGFPYLDKALGPNDNLELPRLSLRETFIKIAADFMEASKYLPEDWDYTQQGIEAPGSAFGRPTKYAALGMYARTMLYLASPWIVGLETRNQDYQEYDLEYCKEAAKAALQVINSGMYRLVDWNEYLFNFARNDTPNIEVPVTDEAIFAYNNKPESWGPLVLSLIVGKVHVTSNWGGAQTISPTLSFVNMFETSSGLPITEGDSGYDKNKPFANRDPRFRACFLFDGVKWAATLPETDERAYVQLYSEGGSTASGAGLDRSPNGGNASSMTGYIIRKYQCYKANVIDNDLMKYKIDVPFMRLAEMYLIYAEAMNEIGGPNARLEGEANAMTALEAINTIRRRVKLPVSEDITKPFELETWSNNSLPDVDERYTQSKEDFRERIRNERSIELAFEGHRFHDIRRWHIAHKLPKEVKGLFFTKGQTNFREEQVYKRVFEYPKHYLFPFKRDDVYLYEGFVQNPGWE